ncbi:MAG: TolC family protein [Bacteroidales bacterium]|jgi:NodT family efflux transporter outer membrane factor (OMF) lipoprotein|nr:TolC family protein [Bacteroidales bacterium]
MKKVIIAALTAFILNGCGIYKPYTRPEVTTDNLFGSTIQIADTTTAGNLHWQKVFTDTGLQRLIRTGLENNTDLRVARLRITQAEASLKAAKLSYFPTVSLNPQATAGSFDGSKVSPTYQLSVGASWEADIFGTLTNVKRQQKAALEQSEAYRQAVQTSLIADIANSYYTLLMLDRQMEITVQTATAWEENVRTMRALKQAGQTHEAAVAQAEANKLSATASVIDLKRQITEVEKALCVTLGETPHAITRGKIENQSLPEKLSVGIPLQLLSNRPDVMSAEASLKQAFYAVNEARSYFYPSFTLSGSVGWTNSAGTVIANPGALLWQAFGSLTQPIFNQGKNKARLKIAKAQQEEALLVFRQTLLSAGAEVNNALTLCLSAQEKNDVYEKQIKMLESATHSIKLLMRHGSATYLEVLTAQQTLLQAQLLQTANRFDEIQGIINLYRALGGGRE